MDGNEMFGTYRIILALMVVALHLGNVTRIGNYAVFGFYTLSGYLMTLIMVRNYGYTTSGRLKYISNRFLRIYPLYWVSIAVSAIEIYFLGEKFTTNFELSMYLPKDISEFLRNLFIYFSSLSGSRLNSQAWSLTVEICFYILIGIGIFKHKRVTIGWFVIGLAYHLYAIIVHLGFEARYFTVFAAVLPFSTGALIFHFKSELNAYTNLVKGKFYDFFPFILMGLIVVNWYIGVLTQNGKGIFFYSNYFLCALMVLVLADRKEIPLINKSFDKWMGDFSYPIFLMHNQVGIIVIYVFQSTSVALNKPGPLLLLISISLIFVVSWLLIIAIEKPIELLRARLKR